MIQGEIQIDSKHHPGTVTIAVLGTIQILVWGGSYFLLPVLGKSIIKETGWPYDLLYGCLSVALLLSGLLSPWIGREIQKGRYSVVYYSGVVIAVGLIIIACSYNLAVFLMGWCIIGAGMGMGLYDAMFAVLGTSYGANARRAIVAVTLISSLTPSVAWAVTGWTLEVFSWRSTCMLYAAVLGLVIFPAYKFIFPAQQGKKINNSALDFPEEGVAKIYRSKLYLLILASFTLGSVITVALVLHLIDVLSQNRMSLSSIMWVTAFLGPSQAAARVIELSIGKRPVTQLYLVSCIAVFAGSALLFFSSATALCGIVLFGIGNGMRSVLRGTLPLSVFGARYYGSIIGRLARLPLIGQAFAPFFGGVLIHQAGTGAFINILCAMAIGNIILALLIKKNKRKFINH